MTREEERAADAATISNPADDGSGRKTFPYMAHEGLPNTYGNFGYTHGPAARFVAFADAPTRPEVMSLTWWVHRYSSGPYYGDTNLTLDIRLQNGPPGEVAPVTPVEYANHPFHFLSHDFDCDRVRLNRGALYECTFSGFFGEHRITGVSFADLCANYLPMNNWGPLHTSTLADMFDHFSFVHYSVHDRFTGLSATNADADPVLAEFSGAIPYSADSRVFAACRAAYLAALADVSTPVQFAPDA